MILILFISLAKLFDNSLVNSEKTCEIIDDCSCKMNTGEIISLHEIDDPNNARYKCICFFMFSFLLIDHLHQ